MSTSYIGKKFSAKLLSRALNDNNIQRYDNWKLYKKELTNSYRLKYYNSYRKLLERCGLDDHMLLSKYLITLYPDEFSYLIRDKDNIPLWNVFGCPETKRDYDIIALTTDTQLPLYPGEEEELIKCFYDSGEYNDTKKTDISYISNKNGSYQTNRGGQETINICFHSYEWHPQYHPPFFKKSDLVPIYTSDKLIVLSKFIMDKAEGMLDEKTYREIRQEKKISYNDGIARFKFTYKLIDLYSMNPMLENWNPSFWKSFMMKLAQAYMVSRDENYHNLSYPYNKLELAKTLSKHLIDTRWNREIENLLMYRYYEVNDEFKLFLKNLYIDLVNNYYPQFSKESIMVDVRDNLTWISNEVFNEFIKSPKNMSQDFYLAWKRHYHDCDDISKPFIELCNNAKILDEYDSLKERVLKIPQRSKKWLNAYHNLYITGRSNGIKAVPEGATNQEKLSIRYNLIMGCIGEQMIHASLLEHIKWKSIIGDFDICTVGMIVEGDIGSRAFCPDAIGKLKNGELFPIEYKTIYSEVGPINNNVFIREYNLARLQLKGAIDVINLNSETPLAKFGFAIFMFIYPNNIMNNNEKHNNENTMYNFELKWSKINF